MSDLPLCPNCGVLLARHQALELQSDNGLLEINLNRGYVCWRGKLVDLAPMQREIVSALASTPGIALRVEALVNITGCSEESNVICALVSRTRRAFERVDPKFDAIKTVRGGRGEGSGSYYWEAPAEALA